jgi:EamA domain-containing membrane protein RarD
MDATVVSLSTLIIPIVALALGHVFLDESVTSIAIAGIVTVLAGVTIAIVTPAKVPSVAKKSISDSL